MMEHQDFQDQKVHRVRREMLDVLEYQESKATQVVKDKRELVDLLDCKERKVTQVLMEQMALKEKKVQKEIEECEEQMVLKDQ